MPSHDESLHPMCPSEAIYNFLALTVLPVPVVVLKSDVCGQVHPEPGLINPSRADVC